MANHRDARSPRFLGQPVRQRGSPYSNPWVGSISSCGHAINPFYAGRLTTCIYSRSGCRTLRMTSSALPPPGTGSHDSVSPCKCHGWLGESHSGTALWHHFLQSLSVFSSSWAWRLWRVAVWRWSRWGRSPLMRRRTPSRCIQWWGAGGPGWSPRSPATWRQEEISWVSTDINSSDTDTNTDSWVSTDINSSNTDTNTDIFLEKEL